MTLMKNNTFLPCIFALTIFLVFHSLPCISAHGGMNHTMSHNTTMGHGNHTMGHGNNTMGHGNNTMGHGNHTMENGNHTMGHGNHTMGHGNHTMGHSNHTMGHGNHTMGHGNHTMGHGNHTMGHGNHTMGHGNHTDGHGNHTDGHGNHGTGDHTNHGATHGSGHGTFFVTSNYLTLFFEDWVSKTRGEFAAMCVVIGIVAWFYEGLKCLRQYVTKMQLAARPISNKNSKTVDYGTGSNSKFCLHLLQTFLHAVQIFLGYLLMLGFMTFNTYLCISIMAGFTLGYLCFGWILPAYIMQTEHDTCC